MTERERKLRQENREMKRTIAALVVRAGGHVEVSDLELMDRYSLSTWSDKVHGTLHVSAKRVRYGEASDE